MSDDRIASGIEIITTSVERQEPRKTRIISAVRPAAIAPSRSTPLTELVTNTDWSNSSLMLSPCGAAARIVCKALLHAVDDGQGRGIAVLDDAEQDRAAAVLAHDVLLHQSSRRGPAPRPSGRWWRRWRT